MDQTPDNSPLHHSALEAEGRHLSTDMVLSAIDFQLALQEKQMRRTGWDKWALLAAFATVTWAAINLVGEARPRGRQLIAAILLLYILSDVIGLVIALDVDTKAGDPAKGKRRPLIRSPIFGRRVAVVFFIRTSLLVCFTYALDGSVAHYALQSLRIYYGFLSFGTLSWLLVSFTKVTTPSSSSFRYLRFKIVVTVAIVSTTLIVAVLCGRKLLAYISGDIHAIKIAILLVAAELILEDLARPNEHPFSNTLARLRHELSMRKIGVLSASEQLDIIVDGIAVSKLVRPQLESLLTELQHVAIDEKRATEAFVAIQLYQTDQAAHSERDAIIEAAVRGSLDSALSAIKRLESVGKAKEKLLTTLRRWEKEDKEASAEIKDLIDTVNSAWNGAMERLKSVSELAQNLKTRTK